MVRTSARVDVEAATCGVAGRVLGVSATRFVVLATWAAAAWVACSSPPPGGGSLQADADPNFGDGLLAGADGVDGAAGDSGKPDAGEDASESDVEGDAGASCVEGDKGCLGPSAAKHCVNGKWELFDKCAQGLVCKEGLCAVLVDCKPGTIDGCAGFTAKNVCAQDGKGYLPIDCGPDELCVENGVCKVTVCAPGSLECESENKVRKCKSDGSGWESALDCKSGAYCLGGTCVSLCEVNNKVASNVGCDYWTADLDNADDGLLGLSNNPMHVPHSVVVSNPGIYDADITFQAKAPWDVKMPPVTTVKAGQAVEIKMPVMNIDKDSLEPKGVFFKSTQPVVAYQFNPFNADKAFSNDGSLLLPQNALGKEYFAISLGSRPDIAFPGLEGLPSQNGYFTVLATSQGTTTVTVTISGKGYVKLNPITKLPINKGQTVTFKLQQYDALNLEAYSAGLSVADLTGSHIVADKPIAVFGGHEEAVLGWSGGGEESCCAEHVEEQLLPVNAWGKTYVAPKSKPRGNEADLWLVMAALPGTTLKTTPPIKGLDGITLNSPGQWVQVETDKSFVVEGSGPIQIAQFLVSRSQTTDFIGDPTMIVHSPIHQMRKDYFILTPKGFTHNWVSVIRPKGVAVSTDGVAIAATEFQPVGNGDWELAYVAVQPGVHRFESKDGLFGLVVYGYGNATAYGYPGGMNLQ